jgi:asparagine synthase (glutamine-hydrolysing)
MAGLCGWFSTEAGAGSAAIDARASTLPALAGADAQSRTSSVGACLVRGGWIAQGDAGRIAAVAGHPRWRDGDLQRLADDADAAQALLQAYSRFGTALFSRVAGDFALVVLDPVTPRLLAAIDRTGQFQLYFAQIPGGVVFGSSASSVLAHPGIERSITPNGLFHYLFFHMLPAPVSLYVGLEKLQGAHRLSHDGYSADVCAYWVPRFEEPVDADADALGEEMSRLIGHAVEGFAREERPGAFLSGGLDSSTVSGMLARLRPGEADTFSIGFEAEGYDEIPYARIASRHFGTRAHEYYVTPEDVVQAVPLIVASYDEPFGNSSALPAYFCARMAAEAGITRMLAGDGGDELFAGNARYAKQGVFEHWYRVPQALRQNLLEPLFTNLPSSIPLLRKLRSYVEQARIPLPDRLQTYNHMHRLVLAEVFEPGFLEQIDTDAPWQLMRDIYERPADASPLNRMLYLDWQQTLADNDLRKVTRMCQLAGVDVVYPMLDDDLVEFSCRVPSGLKLRNGRLRHFYKEATRDFLPREIIDKQKHGFGLPFGVWMHEHRPLEQLAYDSLLRMKTRGFLQPEFIDTLIELHRDTHAAYYGELVWILMMLDLWLDAHPSGGTASD